MATPVILNGVEYIYRYDLGAMMAYERLLKAVEKNEPTPLVRSFMLHFSCLLANDNFSMSQDDFLRCIDTQEVFEMLNKAFEAEFARWSARNNMSETGEEVKKK